MALATLGGRNDDLYETIVISDVHGAKCKIINLEYAPPCISADSAMITDSNDNELLSPVDIVAKLRYSEHEREALKRRVKELESQIASMALKNDVQARQRERALLVNAAQAVVEMDRIYRERAQLLSQKLAHVEEAYASAQKREQELDRQLTESVLTHNEELVQQAHIDKMVQKLSELEHERDRLAASNTYLKQVLENLRASNVKPIRSKSIQVNLRGDMHSKCLQVGRSKLKRLDVFNSKAQTPSESLKATETKRNQ